MMVLQPVAMTNAILASSSVAENDHAEWSPGTTYVLGAQVIVAATHRIYESAIAGNIGHVPTDLANTQWFEVGPTNRWAMFDAVPETATSAAATISITLTPGIADALALLDVVAQTVRVQVIADGATMFDETRDAEASGDFASVLTFLDLPTASGAQILVSIDGTGTVQVGTLLAGSMLDLGQTETGPSAGITDYSRRNTDDFGVTTIIERGWAKTMTLRSRVLTDDVDLIQIAIARLRATPTLWIGELGFASLTMFGFYKSFSLDLALETYSYCSFTIEGLA